VLRAPEIVALPVEMLRISLRPAVVALMVSEPAVRVPAPTARVLVKPVAGRGMVIRPVTLRVLVPLIVTELLAAARVKARDADAAGTLTVTAIPELIVTASAEVGVAAEPATPPVVVAQIAPFQFPVATAKR